MVVETWHFKKINDNLFKVSFFLDGLDLKVETNQRKHQTLQVLDEIVERA